ncbi:hypothetical protein VTK26DRAFT_7062 [Humicola hyalothermophila]
MGRATTQHTLMKRLACQIIPSTKGGGLKYSQSGEVHQTSRNVCGISRTVIQKRTDNAVSFTWTIYPLRGWIPWRNSDIDRRFTVEIQKPVELGKNDVAFKPATRHQYAVGSTIERVGQGPEMAVQWVGLGSYCSSTCLPDVERGRWFEDLFVSPLIQTGDPLLVPQLRLKRALLPENTGYSYPQRPAHPGARQ